MKKIFYLAALAVALTSCQQQAKIGFVDNGVVINDYQEKKDVETKYQDKEAAFRKRADSIGQAFQMEVQSKQAEAQKSSQVKAQEIMTTLQKKQQQLQQQMQMEQQMMQQEFQTDIDSVINRVKAFVKDYGKNNGYTYILGTSEAAATVMYGSEEDDLTKTITDALNEAYKK